MAFPAGAVGVSGRPSALFETVGFVGLRIGLASSGDALFVHVQSTTPGLRDGRGLCAETPTSAADSAKGTILHVVQQTDVPVLELLASAQANSVAESRATASVIANNKEQPSSDGALVGSCNAGVMTFNEHHPLSRLGTIHSLRLCVKTNVSVESEGGLAWVSDGPVVR